MTHPRTAVVLVLIALAAGSAALGDKTEAGPTKPRYCSMEEYRLHLQQMELLVAACSAGRTDQACNPAAVGPDDEVRTSSGSRMVEYSWLRSVLSLPANSARDKTQGTNDGRYLSEAGNRLRKEIAEIPPAQGAAAPNFQQERRTLAGILASGNFTPAKSPSALTMLRDRVLQWLAEKLQNLVGSSHTHWLADCFVFGFLSLACALLLWWFRREGKRRGMPERNRQGEGVHEFLPMQGWQHWLRQGEQFAIESRWRESVHAVYWAAIARLESRGVWPPDQTRTPREYLALFPRRDEKRAELALLTRSFERVWYGRYPAGEQDYRQVCRLQKRLTE